MTSLKVEYERTLSDSRVGGSVVFTVPEDADIAREWGVAYAALKTQVDVAVGLQTSATAVPSATPADEPPEPAAPVESSSSSSSVTPEVSQPPATVTPGTTVEYTGCRVMFNHNEYPAKGRMPAHVRLRIANSEQIPVGTPQGKVNAKSSEPAIMDLLRQFRQGDHVDIRGTFEEPWQRRVKNEDGSQGSVEEWDLVVEHIARA